MDVWRGQRDNSFVAVLQVNPYELLEISKSASLQEAEGLPRLAVGLRVSRVLPPATPSVRTGKGSLPKQKLAVASRSESRVHALEEQL